MTTPDPVERVMELLTDKMLLTQHIYDASMALEDVRIRILNGKITDQEIFDILTDVVSRLDAAIDMPPEES